MTVKFRFYFLCAFAQRLAELFWRDYSICRSTTHHAMNMHIPTSAAIFNIIYACNTSNEIDFWSVFFHFFLIHLHFAFQSVDMSMWNAQILIDWDIDGESGLHRSLAWGDSLKGAFSRKDFDFLWHIPLKILTSPKDARKHLNYLFSAVRNHLIRFHLTIIFRGNEILIAFFFIR